MSSFEKQRSLQTAFAMSSRSSNGFNCTGSELLSIILASSGASISTSVVSEQVSPRSGARRSTLTRREMRLEIFRRTLSHTTIGYCFAFYITIFKKIGALHELSVLRRCLPPNCVHDALERLINAKLWKLSLLVLYIQNCNPSTSATGQEGILEVMLTGPCNKAMRKRI